MFNSREDRSSEVLCYFAIKLEKKFGKKLFVHNGAMFPAFDLKNLKWLLKSSSRTNVVLAVNRIWLLPITNQ